MKIKLSDLRNMSEEERSKVLDEFVKQACRPITQEDIDRWENIILKYETKYGMTTKELQDKLYNGEIQEEMWHCEWLIHYKSLLHMKESFNKQKEETNV